LSQSAKHLPAILALAGVAVITGLVVYFGAGDVLRALTSVHPAGFAKYIVAQLVITLGLALCWRLLLRARVRGSFWLCVWGRLVRDATGEFLPFSQVGGFVLCARVISLGGVNPADAVASTLGDVTAEFLAQLTFIGFGLVVFARKVPGSELVTPIAIGLCLALIAAVGLILAQRGRGAKLFRGLAMKIAGTTGEGAAAHIDRLQVALDDIYAERGRLGLSAVFHLVCWFGTATASYIGFHALGVDLTWWDAMCIEAILHAIMAAAFIIPGRAGVQELAYTVLGGLFGIPPEMALTLSLLRRARDFVIAVPVLIVWQGQEARKIKAAL
jgi:putative membrane protein